MPEPERKLELTPEEWKGWQTGYRAWKLGFKGEEPRLGSVVHGGFWEPREGGEILSDLGPEEDIETSTKGLYSLKSLKEVKEHGYADPGSILGAIIPYGRTVHGERGFRAEKAKVRALFRGATPCSVCEKGAKYLIKAERGNVILCEDCYSKLKVLVKRKGFREYEIEELLNKLADVYGAEVADLPPGEF